MSVIVIAFWLVGTLIVIVGPMILVHELGHFIVAKLSGVRVEEFGLGYPPRLLKLWREKGHLAIDGERVMVPKEMDLPQDVQVNDWVEAVVHPRENGELVLVDLAVPSQEEDREVSTEGGNERRLEGSLTKWEPGTIYSLNLLPLGGFTKMTGEEDPSDPRSLASQPKGQRIAVLSAGVVLNIITAIAILVGAYSLAGVPQSWAVQIVNVQEGTAAEAADLQPGDVLLAAGGESLQLEDPAESLSRLQENIVGAAGDELKLTVLRDGEEITVTATPRPNEEGKGYLGIEMRSRPLRSSVKRFSLLNAVGMTFTDIWNIIVMTLQLPLQLFRGTLPEEARPVSVVGVSQIVTFSLQQSIEWGIAFPVLQTMSLVSLALGVSNLLPLPALDGGRILFVLIEAAIGHRISPELEAKIHMVGFLLLMALMVFILVQDVINPIIPWSLLE